MADISLRDLERLAASGDPDAQKNLLVGRMRAGWFPPIPMCPNCDGHGGPRNDTPAARYMNHAGWQPCKLCCGVGSLPGTLRPQLAAFAGDKFALSTLAPELLRWECSQAPDPIHMPACDDYPWEFWLQALMFKFGKFVAIVGAIGAARQTFERMTPEQHECRCVGADETCDACQESDFYFHVNNALRVFETWIDAPTSSNLVKLEGHPWYGRTFQRLFEGCDAVASNHRRGGVIFWEGIRNFAEGETEETMGACLRQSVASWARKGCW